VAEAGVAATPSTTFFQVWVGLSIHRRVRPMVMSRWPQARKLPAVTALRTCSMPLRSVPIGFQWPVFIGSLCMKRS
jgi:hypothetical protein